MPGLARALRNGLALCLLFSLAASEVGANAADDAVPGEIVPWRVTKAEMKAEWKVAAAYPTFDVPAIDNHVKAWLTAHSAAFMEDVGDAADADGPDMVLEMIVDYEVIATSSNAVSLLFRTIVQSNHAAHPSTTLESLNFTRKGKLLSLESLFAKPERALEIFAEQAPKLLPEYYADRKGELEGLDDWIAKGTEAAPDNYSCYTLEPGGIRVYFQQYQVAPYYLGMPNVLIPLQALASAGPNEEVWPKR